MRDSRKQCSSGAVTGRSQSPRMASFMESGCLSLGRPAGGREPGLMICIKAELLPGGMLPVGLKESEAVLDEVAGMNRL